LLQFFDDVSDAEAVERTKFDLRWKVALGLSLPALAHLYLPARAQVQVRKCRQVQVDYAGFDPTSLVVFRQRLLRGGKERYAFDRFVKVGREAGFIPDNGSVTLPQSDPAD
jgi:hypothetical protein